MVATIETTQTITPVEQSREQGAMSRLVGSWKALGAERWLQRPESLSQRGLKCAQLRERDRLFVSCRHWQLSTGHVLELRWLPCYVDAPIDLIVWAPAGAVPATTAEGFPVLGAGESYAGTSLRACIIAARQELMPRRGTEWPPVEPLLEAIFGQSISPICRVCGCTDLDCSQCVARSGLSCYWVEPRLCSACAAEIVRLVADGPDEIAALAEGLKQREQRTEIDPASEAEQKEIGWLWALVREAEAAPASIAACAMCGAAQGQLMHASLVHDICPACLRHNAAHPPAAERAR
jgi:hypothetical protein